MALQARRVQTNSKYEKLGPGWLLVFCYSFARALAAKRPTKSAYSVTGSPHSLRLRASAPYSNERESLSGRSEFVDDAIDAENEPLDIEVNEQAQSLVGEPQIRQHLRAMDRKHDLQSLQFDND